MGVTDFSKSVSALANSSATTSIKNYGLLFIYEYSRTGATGLFLVKGTTLTKIAADRYDVDNSATFNLSANNGELTIQSTLSASSYHGYVFIGHN